MTTLHHTSHAKQSGFHDYLLKWLGLVSLNAILGFYLGLSVMEEFNGWFVCGMLLGVLSFVPVYAWLDFEVEKKNNLLTSRALSISVYIKASTQLLFLVVPWYSFEIWAGAFALEMLNGSVGAPLPDSSSNSILLNSTFLFSFLATLVTGLALSFVVFMISFVVAGYLLWQDSR